MNDNKLHTIGICPNCNADVSYQGGGELDGVRADQFFFRWKCDCGTSGMEYYNLVFTEHLMFDK